MFNHMEEIMRATSLMAQLSKVFVGDHCKSLLNESNGERTIIIVEKADNPEGYIHSAFTMEKDILVFPDDYETIKKVLTECLETIEKYKLPDLTDKECLSCETKAIYSYKCPTCPETHYVCKNCKTHFEESDFPKDYSQATCKECNRPVFVQSNENSDPVYTCETCGYVGKL